MLRKITSVTTLFSDKLHPFIPGFIIHQGKWSVNCRIFFRRIDNTKSSQDVIYFYQSPQQGQVSGTCRICWLHKSCEATSNFFSVYWSDPDCFADTCWSGISFTFPILCIVSPDMTAFIMPCITSGHTSLYLCCGSRICTNCTTARNTSRRAVSDRRYKVLR